MKKKNKVIIVKYENKYRIFVKMLIENDDKNILKDQINLIQNTYYDENNKHRFVKTKQNFLVLKMLLQKLVWMT